jgi:hypothetical protein
MVNFLGGFALPLPVIPALAGMTKPSVSVTHPTKISGFLKKAMLGC